MLLLVGWLSPVVLPSQARARPALRRRIARWRIARWRIARWRIARWRIACRGIARWRIARRHYSFSGSGLGDGVPVGYEGRCPAIAQL